MCIRDSFFPWTLSSSLMVSLAVAMVFIPLLERVLIKKGLKSGRENTGKKRFNLLDTVQAVYTRALTWTFRFPKMCIRDREMSGREYSIDEVMREIEKETVFMDRSEGGVTFCGGEPLSHPSDLVALLDRCGALGIHRAVDTTLFASPDTVRSVMERTDLFLVDLKHMDSCSHRRFTGVPNERILSNLRDVYKRQALNSQFLINKSIP